MRFEAKSDGVSWKVIDTEILVKTGGYYGPTVPYHVQWCRNEQEARDRAANLNETRGHAVDEPTCVNCGAQPAGGDNESPRCGPCWSRLADMHG